MNFQAFTVVNLLIFLAVLAVLTGALAYGRARRVRVLAALAAAPHDGILLTSLHPGRRVLRHVLFFSGLFFIMLALCRPWWGYHLVPASRQSRDLLFVVDTSRSMLAKDPPPSRLKHAKWWIRELVSRCPGDRFGLIAFAGDAFLECPLTQDANTFLQLLEALDSDTIPVGGTNIAQALKTAEKAFAAAEGSHQAVILVTDGEEQQGTAIAETPWFRDRGIPLFTVGLGNPDSGAILQLEDNSLIRDKAGEPVKSRLNVAALRELSDRTSGIFVHSTSLDANVEPVYRRVCGLVPAEDTQGIQRRPLERYQIPLLLGVFCLLARLLLGERRQTPAPVVAGKATAVLTALLLLAAALPSSANNEQPVPPEPFDASSAAAPAPAAPQPSTSAPDDTAAPDAIPALPTLADSTTPSAQSATISSRVADLEKAIATEKREAEKARLRFNLGTAHHSQGEADAARKEYETVLGMNAKEVPASLRAKACQNLGVLDHDAARKSMQEKPDDAINSLKSSQSFYREGLRLTPQNKDIAGNLEMTERDMKKAEEQKKKQEEMKKQSEQQQKEQKEKQEQAKNDTQQALEKQQQANQEQEQQKREEKQQQANQATEKAKESTEKLNQDQPKHDDSKSQQAAKELDQAQQEQKKTDPQSGTPEEEKKDAGKKAEEHLKKALDKLNESQKEQEKKAGEKKNEGKQGQKPEQQKPENGKKNEKIENQSKPAQEAKPADKQSVDKQQAAAILRQMQEKEKDYREFIKQQQRKNSRMEEVEKNW